LFAEWVSASDDFELSAPVSMGVVCFRFVRSAAGVVDAGPRSPTAATTNHDLDALNSAIVESINQSGRAYLNQTKLRGQTVIRLGLGNILTTEKHLRDAWGLIQETARLVSSSSRA